MTEASAPVKLCECGCGEPTNIAKATNNANPDQVKGQPYRFIAGHQNRGRMLSAEARLSAQRELFERQMPPEEFDRWLAASGTLKWCNQCKRLRPMGEFDRLARSVDGHANCCKSCKKAESAARRQRQMAEDPELLLQRDRDRAKKWRDARKGSESLFRREKNQDLLRDYGITLAQFESMLASQRYRCAICLTLLHGRRAAHVDHDHKTGRVRGILCTHCNRGIGCLRDDPAALRRAARYLERASGRTAARMTGDSGQGALWDVAN